MIYLKEAKKLHHYTQSLSDSSQSLYSIYYKDMLRGVSVWMHKLAAG